MSIGLRQALTSALHRRRLKWTGRTRRALRLNSNSDLELLRLMQEDNAKGPAHYQAGAFWREINSDFETLIYANALEHLRDEYFNRRFAGPDPCSRQVYYALLKLYWDRLLPRDREGFLQQHEDSDQGGGGDLETVYGRRVSLDFLQSVDEALRIKEHFAALRPGAEPEIIVELGAGYGRLAYVCRKMFPESTYVILDLPEALMCAHSFLSRALPNEVVDYNRARSMATLDRTTLRQGRLWLLGAQHIDLLADGGTDVFANVFSLAEMPPQVIANYLHQIDRVTTGLFLTKQREIENNVVDQARIDVRSYPVPTGWRELYRGTATLYEAFFEAAYATR